MRLTLSRPRFTIERLRTLVLVGGVLLVAAIVIFLAAGQWTRHFLSKDLPNRLGINIEQQADGVNYTQTRKGKTIFKIHAARAVTMKTGGKTLLHDVKIDLYGEDGKRADTISGSEFEYDQREGVATAAGAVEITMMRPGVKPAITQLKPGLLKSKPKPAEAAGTAAGPAKASLDHGLNPIAGQITDNEIHVRTSGLVFNQKTSTATTSQRVDFALRQGSGNSIGATYDSQNGQLILDREVELHVARTGGPITVHAGHAEFEHDQMVCRLTQAKAEYTGGMAQTANAVIHFREDGSASQLYGSGGVDLQTQAGSHVTAPMGTLEFDEDNHPRHGVLQGGAHLETSQPNRQIQGSSPTAQLSFDKQGQLNLAHMEQGVLFSSRQQTVTAKGAAAEVTRTWKSQTADVAFAPAADVPKSGHAASPAKAQSRIEPRTIHGYGGVVVTSETGSGGATAPSRLSADTMVAELAPGGALSSLLGTGHASFEERTAAGVRQASTADQLDVRFVPAEEVGAKPATATHSSKAQGAAGSSEIASIVEIGHVTLTQDPPAGHSAQKAAAPEAQSSLQATASRADYDGGSEILHLTGTPRVRDGALDMTADRIDFARATGDAFAHGDVRASWIGTAAGPRSGAPFPGASLMAGSQSGPGGSPGSNLGGNGPVHAIAAEAELHQSTQEVVFRAAASTSGSGQAGPQPRLWQAANSVAAPLIVLNRQKQTLVAEASGAENPVRTILLGNAPAGAAPNRKQGKQSVIRVRSGDLHYSEGERVAVFHSGVVGSVTAETTGAGGTTTVVSQETEVKLLPPGVHPAAKIPATVSGAGNSPGPAAKASAANTSGNTSIERLTARGHVTVDWPDRRGTGEKHDYLSEDGTFTLTGTSSVPPRMTDQARGSVTGNALIYHTGDNSVTVQGDGGKTETETRSKK
jgi:lipopolysaccharide export system protein LptA